MQMDEGLKKRKHKKGGKMKLAEALQERADLRTKIERISSRMEENALVQEGEIPAEDPAELRKELDSAAKRLADVITAINLTNCQTVVEGRTLTEIIAEKDALTLANTAIRATVSAAGHPVFRVRSSEIRMKQTIPVAEWQKEIDARAKHIRELDTLLQKTNWTVDLIE